jgi:hypothetical protein
MPDPADVTYRSLKNKAAIHIDGCPYAFWADLTEFKQCSIE